MKPTTKRAVLKSKLPKRVSVVNNAPKKSASSPGIENYGISIIHAGPGFVEEYKARIEMERWPDPYLPLPIKELSNRTQVYIYNAGPFRQVLEMGSIGTKYLNGIDPKAFFDALPPEPLVIAGLPNEVVPSPDGHAGIRHFYEPIAPYESNPGLGFALEITKDMAGVGVFVTTTNDTGCQEWRRAFGRARFIVMQTAEARLSKNGPHYNPDLEIWGMISGRPGWEVSR